MTKSKKKSSHGGARPGAGRPRLSVDEKLSHGTFREDRATADELMLNDASDEKTDEQFERELHFLYDAHVVADEALVLRDDVTDEAEWRWGCRELARKILNGRVKPQSPRMLSAWARAVVFANDGGDPLFRFFTESAR